MDSVKGTERRGAITITTRRDGDWVEISIADTGGGIPKAISARVFEPFFTTKAVGQGTGRGLALAHSVVMNRHRGKIWFESVPARAQHSLLSSLWGKAETMHEKILLVDDEPAILQGYQRVLHREFQIDVALGGAQALAKIAADSYAVVVSDMHMPGIDGVQLLAKIKFQSPETIRVILTGNADVETAIDAVNEGNIFRFLTKPCSKETWPAPLPPAWCSIG